MENFKEINIGSFIKMKVAESGIDETRIANFLNCSYQEIEIMFASQTIDSDLLLRWSKLLKYDFFRLYSQHLIFYAPYNHFFDDKLKQVKTNLPVFKKNIYTKELILFILEMLNTGEKTMQQVIEEYCIPKTTLYKWIQKSRKN